MYTGLKAHLEVLGWDVETVQSAGLVGAKDRDIVEYAKEHDLLLVTRDQMPSELANLLGVKHIYVTNTMVARMIDDGIKKKFTSSS